MKKTLYLLTSLSFSILFYDQYMGLNALIFSILIIAATWYLNKNELDKKQFLISSTLYFTSSLSVFIYGNELAIIAYFLSFGFHIVACHQKSLSLLTGFLSLLANNILLFYRKIKKSKTNKEEGSKRKFNIVILFIPIALLLLFFGLYRSINEEFKNLTDQINLDFISFGWVFFTLFSLVFLLPVFYFAKQNKFEKFEIHNTSPIVRPLKQTFLGSMMNLKTEYFSAFFSFIILNVLLFTVNILDVLYLYIKVEGKQVMGLSESVHYGVGNLIWTIIISIIVILMFYSDRLNFIKQNKVLKLLSVAWIFQNVFLVISTTYRNFIYIDELGLTYKRIGVYFYLCMTILGLLIVIKKINEKHKIWKMVKDFTFISLVVLTFSSIVNWNKIVIESQLKLSENNKTNIDCQIYKRRMPISALYVNDSNVNCEVSYYNDTKNFLINYSNDWRSFILRDYFLYKKLTE